MDIQSYLLGKKSGGGGSSSDVVGFTYEYDYDTDKYSSSVTPQELEDAFSSGKYVYFYHQNGEFNTQENHDIEKAILLWYGATKIGNDVFYGLTLGFLWEDDGEGKVTIVYLNSNGLNETFTQTAS